MNPHRYDALPVGAADFGLCLVTGAAGFLGTELTRALSARGYRVHAHDLRPMDGLDGLQGVRTFRGDICNNRSVRDAAEGCATVFHTAALMNFLGICKKSVRKKTFDVNLGGTMNVIRACNEVGARRLVYTSTNTVCFNAGPVESGDESRPYAERFIDVYGQSKTAAEQAVLRADSPDGLRTAAIRPAGLWGAGDGCYMMKRFVTEMAAGKLVATIGDGTSLADNTHVVNLILAEFLAAEKLVLVPDTIGGRAYFVTDEEPMNLWEWFGPLIRDLGYKVPSKKIPASLMYAVAYVSEWIHRFGGPRPPMTRLEVHNLTTTFVFKTDRAREELGYRPLVRHREGMRECLPWCRTVLEEALQGISR